MKRYLVLATVATAAAVLLLWPRRPAQTGKSEITEPRSQVGVASGSGSPSNEFHPRRAHGIAAITNATHATDNDQLESVRQFYNRGSEAAVEFYGLVVDQDTNTLENVDVDVAVTQQFTDQEGTPVKNVTRLKKSTGPDGRFEVSGLKGNFIAVEAVTKDGYEPERQRHYGIFGPQSTSAGNPAVLTLWSTNVHATLITSEKKFRILPDGRLYAVDLVKGTIAEGDRGDLIVWVKRPESVAPSEKYSWSCGMSAPSGGLEPESNPKAAMSRAPSGEYTNVFDFHVQYNTQAQSGMSFDNRFYVKLRGGQTYGRLSVDFWTTCNENPAFGLIGLSYAINPSGSRLLR